MIELKNGFLINPSNVLTVEKLTQISKDPSDFTKGLKDCFRLSITTAYGQSTRVLFDTEEELNIAYLMIKSAK